MWDTVVTIDVGLAIVGKAEYSQKYRAQNANLKNDS